MTFSEKLRINRMAYLEAKEKNKRLKREVAERNNKDKISVVIYKAERVKQA